MRRGIRGTVVAVVVACCLAPASAEAGLLRTAVGPYPPSYVGAVAASVVAPVAPAVCTSTNAAGVYEAKCGVTAGGVTVTCGESSAPYHGTGDCTVRAAGQTVGCTAEYTYESVDRCGAGPVYLEERSYSSSGESTVSRLVVGDVQLSCLRQGPYDPVSFLLGCDVLPTPEFGCPERAQPYGYNRECPVDLPGVGTAACFNRYDGFDRGWDGCSLTTAQAVAFCGVERRSGRYSEYEFKGCRATLAGTPVVAGCESAHAGGPFGASDTDTCGVWPVSVSADDWSGYRPYTEPVNRRIVTIGNTRVVCTSTGPGSVPACALE